MRLDSENTLAFHLGIPQRKAANFGAFLTAHGIAPAVRASKNLVSSTTLASPDYDAAKFYALNQMVAKLQTLYSPYEELPPWASDIAKQYATTLAEQNLRSMHYVLLIITREARHLKSKDSFYTSTYGKTLPTDFTKFLSSISGSGSDGAVEAYLSHAPKVPLSTYTEAIRTAFNHGQFGGGFGGKPWGNIAATLEAFVTGKTSGEVFVDTVYTLAHNNGPIFNKGLYYHHYTSDLAHVLDVQRSGQVCELFLEGTYKTSLTGSANGSLQDYTELRTLITTNREPLGIGEYVDWYKVEALGALHSYSALKTAQVKKHGKPGTPATPVPPPIVLMNNKPVKVVGKFYVLPEQSVDIYERLSGVTA